MKITVVFKEFSDQAREVFEWTSEFEHRTGKEIEKVDPESREGEGYCQARGIMEYPTVVVEADDGKVVEQWSGQPLPQIDTVCAYMV